MDANDFLRSDKLRTMLYVVFMVLLLNFMSFFSYVFSLLEKIVLCVFFYFFSGIFRRAYFPLRRVALFHRAWRHGSTLAELRCRSICDAFRWDYVLVMQRAERRMSLVYKKKYITNLSLMQMQCGGGSSRQMLHKLFRNVHFALISHIFHGTHSSHSYRIDLTNCEAQARGYVGASIT